MCHIITDPSDTVQRMAYKMLKESAAKYTEYLVLEAGVDSEAEIKLELPLELIELLQMSLPEEDVDTTGLLQVSIFHSRSRSHTLIIPQNAFGYLLAWMLTFDLFANAVSIPSSVQNALHVLT